MFKRHKSIICFHAFGLIGCWTIASSKSLVGGHCPFLKSITSCQQAMKFHVTAEDILIHNILQNKSTRMIWPWSKTAAPQSFNMRHFRDIFSMKNPGFRATATTSFKNHRIPIRLVKHKRNDAQTHLRSNPDSISDAFSISDVAKHWTTLSIYII